MKVVLPPSNLVKPGGSVAASKRRREVFIERYITNGNNGTEAAIFAGFSAKSAHAQASRLLSLPEIQAMLGTRVNKALHDAQLTTERWAMEMACIGHVDPGELYDAAGNLIPIHLLPEHVRRAIASVEPGDEGMKIKLWDKNAALANIGKHLGVFEQDNRQRVNAIQVVVQLMG